MNQLQSDTLQDHHGWGTIEYHESKCRICARWLGMIFFAHQDDSAWDRLICAECWWKYSPEELGIATTFIVENQEALAKNPTIEGVKPATIVQMGEITIDQLEADVQKVRTENAELMEKYHEVWYNASFTWPYTHFLGVGMMKCPNDLWMYQAIMSRLRPKMVIETGTYQGASALWFAYLMDMLGIEDGRVFTVDFEAYHLEPITQHPRISFLHGNSVDPNLVAAIKAEMTDGPVLVCLDSDHSSQHVERELELYAPLCKVGDWLVVEDTNIGWTDGKEHKITFGGDLGKCSCGLGFLLFESARDRIRPEDVKCPHDRNDLGARGGLIKYMEKHQGEWRQDILAERYLLTMNPGGWLQRVAECAHV